MSRENHPLFNSWRSMMRACYSPRHHAYPFTGALGIQVCERWKNFDGFAADFPERPVGRVLGRLDKAGDFTPENVAWMTRKECTRLRGNNVLVAEHGQWKAATGASGSVDYRTYKSRVLAGEPPAQARQGGKNHARRSLPRSPGLACRVRDLAPETRWGVVTEHQLLPQGLPGAIFAAPPQHESALR